jgi:hypothetical protein
MQRVENVVEIGIERTGEFGQPSDAPEEVQAIETVMGGVEEILGQLVATAREACPNPNCCLTVEVTQDGAEGGSWDEHPMYDTTYTVPFTRVEVGSKRLINCAERADQLTNAVASMVQTCIDATGEADTAGKEKTDAAATKVKHATSTATVKKARETVKTAEDKAAGIKADGETEAQEARDAVYAETREQIVASLSEVAA